MGGALHRAGARRCRRAAVHPRGGQRSELGWAAQDRGEVQRQRGGPAAVAVVFDERREGGAQGESRSGDGDPQRLGREAAFVVRESPRYRCPHRCSLQGCDVWAPRDARRPFRAGGATRTFGGAPTARCAALAALGAGPCSRCAAPSTPPTRREKWRLQGPTVRGCVACPAACTRGVTCQRRAPRR